MLVSSIGISKQCYIHAQPITNPAYGGPGGGYGCRGGAMAVANMAYGCRGVCSVIGWACL
jgi:hypothetical protein